MNEFKITLNKRLELISKRTNTDNLTPHSDKFSRQTKLRMQSREDPGLKGAYEENKRSARKQLNVKMVKRKGPQKEAELINETIKTSFSNKPSTHNQPASKSRMNKSDIMSTDDLHENSAHHPEMILQGTKQSSLLITSGPKAPRTQRKEKMKQKKALLASAVCSPSDHINSRFQNSALNMNQDLKELVTMS